MSQIARRQCFLCHNLLFLVIRCEKLSFPYLIVAPLAAERHVPYRKLRDATDSNQRVSRFCEPLPTAVIPIQAEAASLVEGSCVPSVARPEVERDIPFIFALDFVFYTKGTVPFVLFRSAFPASGRYVLFFRTIFPTSGRPVFFSRSPNPLPVRGRGGSRGAYCVSSASLSTGPRW